MVKFRTVAELRRWGRLVGVDLSMILLGKLTGTNTLNDGCSETVVLEIRSYTVGILVFQCPRFSSSRVIPGTGSERLKVRLLPSLNAPRDGGEETNLAPPWRSFQCSACSSVFMSRSSDPISKCSCTRDAGLETMNNRVSHAVKSP